MTNIVFPHLTNIEASLIMVLHARQSEKEAALLEVKRDEANKYSPTMTGRDLHERAMYLRGHAIHYRKEAQMLRSYPNTKREPWTA